MDRHGSMGSNPHSNNIIINDLLCFVNNNISNISTSTICRLCLETYSSNDILQACSVLKDVTQGSGGISYNDNNYQKPLFSDQMTNEEKTIRCILYILRQQDNSTLPKFVSNGLHLPKINGYCDNNILTPLINEVHDIKDLLYEQIHGIRNDVFNLRKEIAAMRRINQTDFNFSNSINKTKSTFTANDVSDRMRIKKLQEHIKKRTQNFNSAPPTDQTYDGNEEVISNSNDLLCNEKDVNMMDCSPNMQQQNNFDDKNDVMNDCGGELRLVDLTKRVQSGSVTNNQGGTSSGSGTSGGGATSNDNFHSSSSTGCNNVDQHQPSGSDINQQQNYIHLGAPSEVSTSQLFNNNSVTITSEDQELPTMVMNPRYSVKNANRQRSAPYNHRNRNHQSSSNHHQNSRNIRNLAISSNPGGGFSRSIAPNAAAISSTTPSSSTGSRRNAKQHSCEICGYTSTLTDVTKHKRTHTGEKPYSCPVCHKNFSLNSNMLRHFRKHKQSEQIEATKNNPISRTPAIKTAPVPPPPPPPSHNIILDMSDTSVAVIPHSPVTINSTPIDLAPSPISAPTIPLQVVSAGPLSTTTMVATAVVVNKEQLDNNNAASPPTSSINNNNNVQQDGAATLVIRNTPTPSPSSSSATAAAPSSPATTPTSSAPSSVNNMSSPPPTL